MPNDEQEYCSWLHISDLHLLAQQFAENGMDFFLYGDAGKSGAGKGLNAGGLKWYISQYSVDAIVITGDFVLRGDFSDSNLKKLKDFLGDLYKICSDAGKWNWEENTKMERLFWCPGNHDLNREAFITLSGSRVYRKDVIDSAQNGGSFAPKGEQKQLLTKESFSQIYQMMQELAGEPLASSKDGKFEAQVFQIPGKRTPPVFFVAINTALLAGQVAQEENIEKKISRAYKQFASYHHAQNNDIALDKYKEYHKLLKIKRGEMIDDKEKLCFISEARREEIEQEINGPLGHGSSIVILAGHHPYDFLSKEAKSAFFEFARQNFIRLYIHGHTHLLQSKERKIDMVKKPFLSIGVGGANLNPGDDYNQLSFSRGTITKSASNQYELSVMQLLFLSSKYGDRRWVRLDEPIKYKDFPIRNPDSPGSPDDGINDENGASGDPNKPGSGNDKIGSGGLNNTIDQDEYYRNIFNDLKTKEKWQ